MCFNFSVNLRGAGVSVEWTEAQKTVMCSNLDVSCDQHVIFKLKVNVAHFICGGKLEVDEGWCVLR